MQKLCRSQKRKNAAQARVNFEPEGGTASPGHLESLQVRREIWNEGEVTGVDQAVEQAAVTTLTPIGDPGGCCPVTQPTIKTSINEHPRHEHRVALSAMDSLTPRTHRHLTVRNTATAWYTRTVLPQASFLTHRMRTSNLALPQRPARHTIECSGEVNQAAIMVFCNVDSCRSHVVRKKIAIYKTMRTVPRLCMYHAIFSFKAWTHAIVQNTCIKACNRGAHCHWTVRQSYVAAGLPGSSCRSCPAVGMEPAAKAALSSAVRVPSSRWARRALPALLASEPCLHLGTAQ